MAEPLSTFSRNARYPRLQPKIASTKAESAAATSFAGRVTDSQRSARPAAVGRGLADGPGVSAEVSVGTAGAVAVATGPVVSVAMAAGPVSPAAVGVAIG
jgi:hypothetical protein